MVISPTYKDFSTVFYILGKLLLGLSLLMCIPLGVALVSHEYGPFLDFFIAVLTTANFGLLLIAIFPFSRDVRWGHSFFIVSLGWLLASIFGAIPFALSSHYESFVDAWFEAMSGFATTGLTLVKDLDHLPVSINMWRHLTMFIGGQGIVLASISLLSQAKGSLLSLYVGEARTEKILPNIIATARFIWKVSLIYFFIGTSTFTFILLSSGMSLRQSIFQGMWLFFAAFDTGGFVPYAQNINFYHNAVLEIMTLIFMMFGAFNFNLHYWLWFKDKREIYRNLELRTFTITILVFTIILFFSLSKVSTAPIFRKGFYQLISAHTGCGFTNLTAFELKDFPQLGLVTIILAMMIGGSICSTTGAIKLMRIRIIFKSFKMEIKKMMMPQRAVYKEKFHHLTDIVIDDRLVRESFVIFSLFVLTYIFGCIVGMVYGYDFLPALFESVSATANVGLSLGITNSAMPLGLKITYILQMWLGRLEFVSILVSLSLLISAFRK